MKNRIVVNLVHLLLLLTGLSLLLYPTFLDHWKSFHQSQVIARYAEDIGSIEEDKYIDSFDQILTVLPCDLSRLI